MAFPVLPSTNATYKKNAFTLPDSTVTSPNDAGFTLQELVTYWQPGWANLFLKYHPEYCKLQFCDTTAQYQNWDQRVEQDFTKASDVPSIPTPSGVSPLSYSSTNASDWLLPGDPFFATGGMGHSYYTQMDNDLLNYSKNVLGMNGAPIKGLMKYDDYLLYCQDKSGNMNTGLPRDSNWTQCTPVSSCRVVDREWALYSQYYFELKQKYYQLLQNSIGLCATDTCGIGQTVAVTLPNTPTRPSPSEFSIQAYAGTPTCTGKQTAVLVHNAGSVSQAVTAVLYYPSSYTDPGLVKTVTMASGTSQQTFCVPNDIPVSQIAVSSTYCGSPPYGNDSTWVVHFSDVAGGTLNNDCGNRVFSVRTTTITLEDSHGNPVIAVSPVTVTYTLVVNPYCTDTTIVQNIPQPLTIPIGQSSASLVYPTYVSCEINCHWSPSIDRVCVGPN